MTTPDTVTESLLQESRQKRRRIATSWWPKARLVGEILWHQADRDSLFTHAAALTYKTLFSLLPILVLSLLMVSTLTEGKSNALGNSVKQLLFRQLSVDKLQVTDQAGNSTSLENFADGIIANAQHSINGKMTGLVAFGVLVYGAISLMAVIESTFNKLYGSIKPRTWGRRILLYWAVLTLGPLGVAASFTLGRAAYMTASSHVGAGVILPVVNAVTGFLVSWLLLLLMFRIVPDTRVRWHAALAGSLFAAVSWEVGKWAFGIYVQMVAKNSVYGSLAMLPLFMFWLYITWCVTLVGLEISYVMQFWPLLKRTFFFTRAGRSAGLSDLRWIVPLGVLLHQRFKVGKAVDIEEAAEALMLPNDVTGELMEALEKAGLVHETSRGAYSLARPPEKITAYDLLTAARVSCQVPPGVGDEKTSAQGCVALKELEKMEAEWARGHTLAGMAGE